MQLDEILLSRFIPMSGIQASHLRELCGHTELIHLDPGDCLSGEPTRADSIYYVVDGTVHLSGGKAPEETVTGGARNARFALIGMEDVDRKATAQIASTLIQVDRAKVSTLLIFTQSPSATPAQSGAELASLLLKSGLFSCIPPSNIERIGELIEPIEVPKNQIVVEQDSEGDHYYIIKHGRCDVLRKGQDGVEMHLANLGPGDSFGEEALISGTKRNASIRMSEPGVLMRLTRDYFIELISKPLLQAVSHDRAGDLIASGAQWIDVRLTEEFERDGLQGALSIPLAELRSRYSELDPEGSYITYCNTGRRSQAGAFLISQRGISTCYLDIGIAHQRPEVRGVEAIRQELPELQAQLARVNQELEDALLDKAAADAAEEIDSQGLIQRQAKNEADERHMRLAVEAQKANELLDCAKEQKRSLERLVREAQAEAESRRRQAAAQCEHLQKHAQKLIEDEKQRLKACYEMASKQLESIEHNKALAEAQFETERKRLEDEFEITRRKMAVEASAIRSELEQAKQNSEQQAHQIRNQHTQQEQDLRAKTEAMLREERAKLESEFAETIATQEKARHDLEMAETARQSAKQKARKIQAQIDAQHKAQQLQKDQITAEQSSRLRAEHDAAEAKLKLAHQRLEAVEAKRGALSGSSATNTNAVTQEPTVAPENIALNEEARDADLALQAAEFAQNEAAKAQQQAQDIIAVTKVKEDELRIQLYGEMEEWAKEEEAQSKTDIERALKYAAEMQRIQKAKQEKQQSEKVATDDLFSDLKNALEGNLETDPFDDYIHDQLVAEEKARLIKNARITAAENKQQVQQSISSLTPDSEKK